MRVSDSNQPTYQAMFFLIQAAPLHIRAPVHAAHPSSSGWPVPESRSQPVQVGSAVLQVLSCTDLKMNDVFGPQMKTSREGQEWTPLPSIFNTPPGWATTTTTTATTTTTTTTNNSSSTTTTKSSTPMTTPPHKIATADNTALSTNDDTTDVPMADEEQQITSETVTEKREQEGGDGREEGEEGEEDLQFNIWNANSLRTIIAYCEELIPMRMLKFQLLRRHLYHRALDANTLEIKLPMSLYELSTVQPTPPKDLRVKIVLSKNTRPFEMPAWTAQLPHPSLAVVAPFLSSPDPPLLCDDPQLQFDGSERTLSLQYPSLSSQSIDRLWEHLQALVSFTNICVQLYLTDQIERVIVPGQDFPPRFYRVSQLDYYELRFHYEVAESSGKQTEFGTPVVRSATTTTSTLVMKWSSDEKPSSSSSSSSSSSPSFSSSPSSSSSSAAAIKAAHPHSPFSWGKVEIAFDPVPFPQTYYLQLAYNSNRNISELLQRVYWAHNAVPQIAKFLHYVNKTKAPLGICPTFDPKDSGDACDFNLGLHTTSACAAQPVHCIPQSNTCLKFVFTQAPNHSTELRMLNADRVVWTIKKRSGLESNSMDPYRITSYLAHWLRLVGFRTLCENQTLPVPGYVTVNLEKVNDPGSRLRAANMNISSYNAQGQPIISPQNEQVRDPPLYLPLVSILHLDPQRSTPACWTIIVCAPCPTSHVSAPCFPPITRSRNNTTFSDCQELFRTIRECPSLPWHCHAISSHNSEHTHSDFRPDRRGAPSTRALHPHPSTPPPSPPSRL